MTAWVLHGLTAVVYTGPETAGLRAEVRSMPEGTWMAWVDQLAESGVLYPLWHREGFLSVGRAKNACRQVIHWDRWRRSKIRGRQVGLFRSGGL